VGISVDAAPAYDDVFAQNPEIVEVGCWAHARRYFKEAMPTAAVVCAHVLALRISLIVITRFGIVISGFGIVITEWSESRWTVPLWASL
jgi:hypothetical protein